MSISFVTWKRVSSGNMEYMRNKSTERCNNTTPTPVIYIESFTVPKPTVYQLTILVQWSSLKHHLLVRTQKEQQKLHRHIFNQSMQISLEILSGMNNVIVCFI